MSDTENTQQEEVATQETQAPAVNKVAAPVVTAEELVAHKANVAEIFGEAVSIVDTVFRFRKSVDAQTKVTTEREPLTLPLPVPSVEGIMAIIEEGMKEDGDKKGLELLLSAMESEVNQQARSLISDDETLFVGNFPWEKLSWSFIANMPKAERRGGGIPKENWEDFAADYAEVMPEAAGKTKEQVANAVKLFLNKFSSIKTHKPMIKALVGQLAIYAEKSPNVETHQECVAFLLEKADKLVNVSDEDLLANI